MPIDAKNAVRSAYEYLMGASIGSEKYSNFRLEEMKKDENDNFIVTLSYDVMGDFAFDKTRQYKEFVVSGVDASVISMTIRNV